MIPRDIRQHEDDGAAVGVPKVHRLLQRPPNRGRLFRGARVEVRGPLLQLLPIELLVTPRHPRLVQGIVALRK